MTKPSLHQEAILFAVACNDAGIDNPDTLALNTWKFVLENTDDGMYVKNFTHVYNAIRFYHAQPKRDALREEL